MSVAIVVVVVVVVVVAVVFVVVVRNGHWPRSHLTFILSTRVHGYVQSEHLD